MTKQMKNKWIAQNKRWTALMILTQEGDSSAYNELLSSLHYVLSAYFGQRLWDKSYEDDLIQDTLMSVHTSRHTYDPYYPFTAWLFGIAHHKFIDFLRKNKRIVSHEIYDDTLFERLCINSNNSSIDSRIDLEKALEQLPAKQKEALKSFSLQGYSSKDSSKIMGIGLSALKVNVHRGYKRLKNILGDDYGNN